MPLSKNIEIVSKEQLAVLPFWNELSKQEQDFIQQELTGLRFATNALAKGRHLSHIQMILSPRELALYSLLHCEDITGMSPRAGYRMIQDYQDVVRCVNQPVTDEMIRRNIRLLKSNRPEPLGDYQRAYVALVVNGIFPPVEAGKAAEEYVKHLEIEYERHKAQEPTSRTPKAGKVDVRKSEGFITKRMIIMLRRDMRILPVDRREAYLETVIGTALSLAKIPEKTFKAVVVPTEFRRTLQRPQDRQDDLERDGSLFDLEPRKSKKKKA